MNTEPGRRPLVVITDDRFGDADVERAILEPAGLELLVAKCRSSAEVASAARAADALLVNLAPVDASAIEALGRCRVISRYGVGLDNIDVEAAARRGIAVKTVSDYCTAEVAEHALALLLACARGIAQRDRAVRARGWDLRPFGRRVAGTTLGILGFGGTARAFARSALGLGFRRILIWSPAISQRRIEEPLGAAAAALGTNLVASGFDELLAQADWVSVHLPLKPETRGLIGRRELSLMKSDAVLVNVSRGAVIDEAALVEALSIGRLGAAGLDVFAVEPLPAGSGLRTLPGVVLSDHSAYASRESIEELRRRAAQNVLDSLRAE